MKESIVIRNFGPIKDIEIDDIRPFTVFIGESGSGKSTVMKVIILFRWIYKMVNIRSYLRHANITQSPFTFTFKTYLKNNGIQDYLKKETEIVYSRGNNQILYNGYLDASVLIPEDELSLEKMSFIADKRILIPDILAAQKITAKKNDLNIDDTISFFLRETYNDFKNGEEYIQELNFNYLGVKYLSRQTNSGTKYYIKSLDDNENYTIKLEDASSGLQTVTPLSVIIEYFSKYYNFQKSFNDIVFKYMAQSDNLKDFRAGLNIGEIKNRNIHIHIEEPELSLYPESQRSLMNFIINRCFVEKHNDYNMTVMLATHSPYIINHLNLLILAGKRNELEEGASLILNDVDVFEITDGYLNSLKRENNFIIDTRPLSEPISNIYEQ
jgi:predicted ATPase